MEELFEGTSPSLIIMNVLVRIFPAFSRIQTVYGEIRSIPPYSVRMRQNARKMWTRIIANTDTFFAVNIPLDLHSNENKPLLKWFVAT